MPESQQTTQDVAGVTRTPTGTISDQNPTLTQPSTESKPQTDQVAEALKSTTPPSSETPKAKEPTDGKPPKSLINEESAEKGAPESYSEFTGPEGFKIDGEVAQEIGATFKGLDLSQAQAQSLVDLFVKYNRESAQQVYDKYSETRQSWRDQLNSDPEIGGTKLRTTIASIGKLIDSFGKYKDGFREALDYTGAGDHPAVVGALYTISKILTEGAAVRGNGPSTEGQRIGGSDRPSAARAMYPHLTSNQTG